MSNLHMTEAMRRRFILERDSRDAKPLVDAVKSQDRNFPYTPGDYMDSRVKCDGCVLDISHAQAVPLRNLTRKIDVCLSFPGLSMTAIRSIQESVVEAARVLVNHPSHGASHDCLTDKDGHSAVVVTIIRWSDVVPNTVDYEVIYAYGPRAASYMRALYPEKMI